MRQRTGSALHQEMACHLVAPSHFFNQCWLIVNWTFRNKPQWNSIKIHNFPCMKMHLKMSFGKWRPFCPGVNINLIRLCTDWSVGRGCLLCLFCSVTTGKYLKNCATNVHICLTPYFIHIHDSTADNVFMPVVMLASDIFVISSW